MSRSEAKEFFKKRHRALASLRNFAILMPREAAAKAVGEQRLTYSQ